MYTIFEISKVLSLTHQNARNPVEISLSTYAEVRERTVLAIVCSNGYLLFRTTCHRKEKPVVHQVRWFHQSGKQISAICLDPSASWLLVGTLDGSLYILPPLMGSMSQPSGSAWRTDDVKEIRLASQRATPTAIRWWKTQDGQQMAVIGNELGEVFILNLKSQKEIGNIYIPVAVQGLECIQDLQNGSTCLLILGTNSQQWHLLLEDTPSGFTWLSEQVEVGSLENLERKMWQLQGDRTLFVEEKRIEGRHLARYEGDAILTSQQFRGQPCVSAYTKTTGVLQLLTNKLEMQANQSSYVVPSECRNIILTEKLVFAFDAHHNKLIIMALQTLEASKKGKEVPSPDIQQFSLHCPVSAMYLCSSNHRVNNISATVKGKEPISPRAKERLTPETVILPFDLVLDGCLIITKDSVYQCMTKDSCVRSFLKLTQMPTDLPLAERLGVLLGLDIHSLYEIAAEIQLSQGRFAQAVRLYQLSKCPQLKRVAYFVSYGFLSELIAYIQVLFSTKSMEVAMLDRVHFANMALNCFVQQVLERNQERPAVLQAFRDFLRDNQHYDDEVAIRLLQEQGLYDLLYFCTKLRGQQRLMIEYLLASSELSREALECKIHDAVQSAGYGHLLVKSQNENYIECVTSPSLLQHLALKPQLLRCHLQHVAQMLPSLQMDPLLRVAKLYDPCHPAFRLAVRSVLSTSQCHRYFSLSSLSSISSDSLELTHGEEENVSEEDLLKFFVFVLLVLNHKRSPLPFDPSLLNSPCLEGSVHRSSSGRGLFGNGKRVVVSPIRANGGTSIQESPIACGASHSAYIQQGTLYTWGKNLHGRLGHGEATQECSPVMGVDLLDLKVLSISCGAFHTVALTNQGVFAWGSSKYGQLGMGELQRTCRPLLIEALVIQQVVLITCGQYHSLAVTSDGKVFSWGWGVHGQLGHGDPEDYRSPKRIDFFLKDVIISAAAGHCHSIVLTHKGHVYAFGCGMFGQLGQQGRAVKSSRPLQVMLTEPIGLISSGYFHCLALSKLQSVAGLQRLYVWGAHPQSLRVLAQSTRRARMQHHTHCQQVNTNGPGSQPSSLLYGTSPHIPSSMASFGSHQQQYSSQQQAYLLPTLVNTSNVSCKIVKIACGSQHSSLLTQDGEIFTWGRNSEGQLGHGTRKEQKAPSMVLSLNDCQIVQVACGFDFTLALDSTGRLFGWGQNDSGQLGQKPLDLPPPQHSPRPRISGSAVHSSSGRVITIRTNRRMITITQSCRQGELRPIQVVSLPPQILPPSSVGSIHSGNTDFEINSIEKDINQLQSVSYYERESPLWPLHQEPDVLPYGPRCLHLALKVFHKHYEPTSVLNHCLSFSNHQAAAELCTLEGLYAQATDYQLSALEVSKSSLSPEEFSCLALTIIRHYILCIDVDNYEANRQFLEYIAVFWSNHNLEISILENFFFDNLNVIGYPLGLMLFCNNGKQQVLSVESLVKRFTTNFLVQLTLSVMDRMDSGHQHPELLDHVMEVSGTTTLLQQLHAAETLVSAEKQELPSQTLWQEIVHNFQKGLVARSSLHLSSSALDVLTRSLASQSDHAHKGVDVVAFTCGHNYTMQTFQGSVLPCFREALYKLPGSLKQTQRLLLIGYQGEEQGLLPLACPPCVLTEIKGEL